MRHPFIRSGFQIVVNNVAAPIQSDQLRIGGYRRLGKTVPYPSFRGVDHIRDDEILMVVFDLQFIDAIVADHAERDGHVLFCIAAVFQRQVRAIDNETGGWSVSKWTLPDPNIHS